MERGRTSYSEMSLYEYDVRLLFYDLRCIHYDNEMRVTFIQFQDSQGQLPVHTGEINPQSEFGQ